MKIRTFTMFMLSVIAMFFLSCESVNEILTQKPTANLKGIGFDEVGLQSSKLLFNVEVKNPYNVPLPLVNMDYLVNSNANKLFSGDADLQTTIPANDSKTVSLPVSIDYIDMIKAFKDVRPGSMIPYKANVGLSLDAPVIGRLRMPLNKKGQVAVPDIPNLNEIDFQQLLDKAQQLRK